MGPNPFWSQIPILIANMVASGGQFTWPSVPGGWTLIYVIINVFKLQNLEWHTYVPNPMTLLTVPVV